jgi:hypothetical protein
MCGEFSTKARNTSKSEAKCEQISASLSPLQPRGHDVPLSLSPARHCFLGLGFWSCASPIAICGKSDSQEQGGGLEATTYADNLSGDMQGGD